MSEVKPNCIQVHLNSFYRNVWKMIIIFSKEKKNITILVLMNYCFQSLALCPKLWYNIFWLTSRRWPNVHFILLFPFTARLLKDKKLQFVHPGTLLIASPVNCNFNRLLNQIWRFPLTHGKCYRVFSYKFSQLVFKNLFKFVFFKHFGYMLLKNLKK